MPRKSLFVAPFVLAALWIVVETRAAKEPKESAMTTVEKPAIEGLPRRPDKIEPVVRTEEEWRRLLGPERFAVMRRKGTEQAFSCPLLTNHKPGIYRCAGCGLDLFQGDTKFESGTGWPSFWRPLNDKYTRLETDTSFGMERTEVLCARCGAHLGHVFHDGPPPTGLRYCMNGLSLIFDPAPEKSAAAAPAAKQ